MAFLAAAVPYITAAAAAYGAYSTYQTSKEAKKQQATPLPALPAPTEMPNADAQALTAKRASVAELLRRRGRASTILTDDREPLG